MLRFLLICSSLILLAGCTSSSNDDVLRSTLTPQEQTVQNPQVQIADAGQSGEQVPLDLTAPQKPSQQQQATSLSGVAYNQNQAAPADQPQFAFATDGSDYQPILQPRTKKTYLINGLASSVPSIGYGFTNLSKKIPGSVLYNYASFVESSTIIRSRVTRQLKDAYRQDPGVEINLIGISFGANIVTLIAADLDRSGIPVNYLVTMEGPAMVPINDNVRLADNFSCTNLDCFRTKSRLAHGNRETQFSTFKVKTSHIPLADHPDVHSRILYQLDSRPTEPLVAVQ